MDDLLLAWAEDSDTGQPRYILQLDANHRGERCNCRCPSCQLPLSAINAAKSHFILRPHFRHPAGAERAQCAVIAARLAVTEMFRTQGQIQLPRKCVTGQVEGLSGHYFNAQVMVPAETVRVATCQFKDTATAILTLDDGRELMVRLTGRGVTHDSTEDSPQALIDIDVDDPAIATMSPDEILSRLRLSWEGACWSTHWADAKALLQAEEAARQQAMVMLDWIDASDLPGDCTPAERRETLLHREAKAILARAMRIQLPEVTQEVTYIHDDGIPDGEMVSLPAEMVVLTSVELEVRLGRSIPDLVVSWDKGDGSTQFALIEIAVTNPLTPERIERLSGLGFPVLEIDIGRMSGQVSRDEFARLIVDEVAGKQWQFHPELNVLCGEAHDRLRAAALRRESAQRQLQTMKAVPVSSWVGRLMSAFRQRSDLTLAGEASTSPDEMAAIQSEIHQCIDGLTAHGAISASLIDEPPLRPIIERLMTIRDNRGVGCKLDAGGLINSIQMEKYGDLLPWHTLYLIAIKVYAPSLTQKQHDLYLHWRSHVAQSLLSEESTYVRDTLYDSLIAGLFPEMRRGLYHPFGTPLYIPDETPDDDLLVREFGGVIELNPAQQRASLVMAAGQAINERQTPISFAMRYASNHRHSVSDVMAELLSSGVARNRHQWS